MDVTSAQTPRWQTWLKLAPLVILIAFVVYEMRMQVVPVLNALQAFVARAGAFGPAVMAAAIGVWLTLVLPAPVILGLTGTVYAHSPLLAVVVSSVGVTLAQAAGFILARSYVRQAVLGKLGHRPWFQKLTLQVEQKGARGVFFVRLLPVFPNTLCNYAFGLTNISFIPYLLASWAGSLPLITILVLGTSGFVHLLEK